VARWTTRRLQFATDTMKTATAVFWKIIRDVFEHIYIIYVIFSTIVPSSVLPLVSGINSRLLSVNYALISPTLILHSPIRTSPVASIDSPRSSSIASSLFHSRLKAFPFCKSFPRQPSFSSSGLTPRIPPGLFTDTCEHIRFSSLVLLFLLFGVRFSEVD